MKAPESDGFALSLPPALVEAIAEQVADRLAERMTPPAEPYLDVEQAAEYLATKPKRIHELKEANKIPCLRDGRRLLFCREDLDEYVRRG